MSRVPKFRIFEDVCFKSDPSDWFTIASIEWVEESGYFMYRAAPGGIAYQEHLLKEYVKPFFEYYWVYRTFEGNLGITHSYLTDRQMRMMAGANPQIENYEKIDITKRMVVK